MDTAAETDLVLAAQAGDEVAFETLVGRHRIELVVHCYRMLGSLHDAEDVVQNTLLRAWEKRASLANPAAYRAWLYRIATNLCLNVLSRAPRRTLPSSLHPASGAATPLAPGQREPIWLEPFPDDLLADQHLGPEDHAFQRERLTLAFLLALQGLTPQQRAVLLLREVLDWPAAEVAEWLNLSVAAVNSLLQRARRALRQHIAAGETPPPASRAQELLKRYMALWEQADIPGLALLLREDAWFSMPPVPTWFQGRQTVATVLATRIFSPGREMHLIAARANGSPAFGLYQRTAGAGAYRFVGLFVLGLAGQDIAHLVAFLDPSSLSPRFAMPPTLPA